MKIKIKTIVFEWSGMLRCIGQHEGPVVELDEDDVMAVEFTGEHWRPDEYITAYLYRKHGASTLTVTYNDLLPISPRLAALAKKSMIRKANAPDPDCGSCS